MITTETLSPEAAVAFLLAERLLEEPDFLAGDFRVEEAAGRNRCFRVISSEARSYFVKQAQPGDAGGARGIGLEAGIYAWVHGEDRLAALRPFLPRLHWYDPTRALLVLELRPTLRTAYEAGESDPVLGIPRVAEALGAALAACHSAPLGDDDGTASSVTLPQIPPWVLDITRPPPDALQDLSPAQAAILRLLQERPEVRAELDVLRTQWVASRLVHGDLKWGNLLVEVEPASGRPVGVRLIDWELAAFGDPAWDVGSAFHSYLSHCVLVLPLEEDANPEMAAAAFATSLPRIHQELRLLWTSYVCAVGLTPSAQSALLDRAVGYCAARLLQSAYEWAQCESRVPRSAAAILQLALNILSHPRTAMVSVLGLSADAGAAKQ